MTREKAPWWGRVSSNIWKCKDGNKVAEVRQIGEVEYMWSVNDNGDEWAGTANRCVEAMRAAEKVMGY